MCPPRCGRRYLPMTHEPELTEPVDLCTDDGSRLHPAARGWSRRPLHRANLLGENGRNKRWDYWAVLAGDLVISSVYSNTDYLGMTDVFWVDLVTAETGGAFTGRRNGDGFVLPEQPGTAPLRYQDERIEVAFTDDDRGTHLFARWTERDGRAGVMDIVVAQPAGHESLNVVIPWSDTVFNFTSKHQARPASGVFRVGDRAWSVGADGDAWGVLDVGRGRWPKEITWNWGGGAGVVHGHTVGIQIGAKWTAGTGFTENGLIVDGRLSKIGNELDWRYDWDNPMQPWRVTDPGGQLDIVLTPRFDKHTNTQGRKRGTEVHQVFGTWSGELTTDDGTTLRFDGLQGFAEEARQNW